MIILVTKRTQTQIGDILIDEDDILPPLNFAANVIGPTTVKLEWRPSNEASPDVYYLVNVKQLTSESGESLMRQQAGLPDISHSDCSSSDKSGVE